MRGLSELASKTDLTKATLGPSRRELLKALGGGMLVAVFGPPVLAQESGRQAGGAQSPRTVAAWLHIGTDGRVTIFTGKVELGQNARTNLTQAAAEELRLPMAAVDVVMGDTDLCPFDQGTFGSQTTPRMVPQIRRAAATAREALIDLAAKKLNVDRANLKAAAGKISQSGGTASATYGELAKDFPANLELGTQELTPTAEWKVMGKSVPKVGGSAIVTGVHQYAYDLSRPGMLHAKVLRPPSMGATLVSADTKAAEAVPSVKIVQDGNFVAVAAPSQRAAIAALRAIKAEWKETPQPSAAELFGILRGKPVQAGPIQVQVAATPQASVAPTAQPNVLGAVYTTPYIAHVPLEPRAALAVWDGQKMTVHTGCSRPFGARDEIAQALDLPPDQVRVIVPDTGCSYGGKHTGDAAVEAAKIAKALGKPVKVVWSREEEFSFAYFRPAGVIEVRASLDASGLMTSWQFDNYNSGPAAIDCPYAVPGARAEFHRANSPLRQGSYRGLASAFNNFARESFIDELAALAKLDPLEFRLKNLKNDRLRAVLETAASKFGWGKAKPVEGHAFGLACGMDKGGYVANCVEVAIGSDKEVRVLRAVTAFECGAIVNPEQLRNQIEGSVIMGLGGALFEAIDFANGKVLTDRLSKYRVPRFLDVPKLETYLLDRKDLPSAGGGECGIVGICPAIGNAIYSRTGQRLRAMPLKLA